MNETAETKICPLCAEKIKAAAKVCPYCRKSQRRWVFVTCYDVMAIFVALCSLGVFIFILASFRMGRTYAPARDHIEILNSQFAVESNETSTNLIISGVISNGSTYAWSVGELETRFFDKEGKITDATTDSVFITILPHSEQAFRTEAYEMSKIPEYASYKIRVTSVRDPRRNLFE
jgi:hypothetical protein